MDTSTRQYELVLFGATGYTGKLCAEHIAKNLPTDLKWAIAGRNEKKLSEIAKELKSINSDRIQPEIEIAELNDTDLDALAKKTRVLLTTVGPYHKYGEHAFKACATNGTHYIDCTGEVPWLKDMIEKYEETAKSNGAILQLYFNAKMIPQCGIDSAPPDLLTYLLGTYLLQTHSAPLTTSTITAHRMKTAPSGGTLTTILTLTDTYPLRALRASTRPFALSPVQPASRAPRASAPLLERVLGVRRSADLGVLTAHPGARGDAAIVYRSWGLLDAGAYYAPRFAFSEWTTARGVLAGAAWHWGLLAGTLALALPPVRAVLRRLVAQPGQGPAREAAEREEMEYRGVGEGMRNEGEQVRKARATWRFKGGMYLLTGILMAEAAMVITRGKGTRAHEAGGGILTPAMLGEAFAERIRKVGIEVEVGDRFVEERARL
ncbi:hypothetical protein BDY21DRAFT_364583 [Lineolata rhizophorae]|uniref:Saccharopine dehydrogenase NADP binding domain-containing protein n=1 Tax=Lineolata rhizophorae TaxID=578093 RepID=A0A6A6NXE0_9PEZI|nr:hypothetical protein BDY21DRAFT_364583 [Lineolata rhizophorae]